MAFKRYIHKHGKKLGPYYYENVRSPDGKVKTVYVGTNPEHHPKHRIRKPLVFMILALLLILILGGSLFFLQNKAYLSKKVILQQPDFSIDQILLKVLVRSGEYIEKQVRIMNTGNDAAGIDVIVIGLFDIVKIDSPSFSLKPGQTKILALNFSSYLPEQKIEQQPGIYIGKLTVKSEKALKDIPIVVEIETKNVLFDMNLNPVAIERRVKQGADTTIEVRLFNLESIESQNVDVEYFVKDMNGNTIVTESETVVVKTQASFFKTVSVPKNLNPGPYVFAAIARFGSSIGTSSYLFDVVGPEEVSFTQFCKNNVLCLGLSLATMLLLFALAAYFYFFVGAYLYEKITGAVTLQKKKKEKPAPAEPRESFVEKAKGEISQWKEKIEKRKAEKEERKIQFFGKARNIIDEWKQKIEARKAEKEARAEKVEIIEKKPSANLKEFYKILEEAKSAISNNDAPKVDELYRMERQLYAKLSVREKNEVYNKLMELYSLRGRFVEKRKKQEDIGKMELGSRQAQSERQKGVNYMKKSKPSSKLKKFYDIADKLKISIEKRDVSKSEEIYTKASNVYANLPDEEKGGVYEILNGFYKQLSKLEEEKKQEEELKKKEQAKKQKELEKQRALEEKKRQREDEARLKDEERKRMLLERRKLAEQRKEKAKEFLHKIGLYRTPEEKKQIALQKEKERQEKLKLEEELRKQREAEEKQKELGEQRIEEEKRKREEASEKQKAKEERARQKEEESKRKEEEKNVKEEQKRAQWQHEKLRLQGKKELAAKPETEGEVEELEEAIKSLDMFKEEAPKEKKIVGKSSKFEKCRKALNDAKNAFESNNPEKAKKVYIEARKLYVDLDYNERKEVYDELMELYNKLAK